MARKTYNEEFKTAAAELVRDQGCSIQKAAESLGVSPGAIRAWADSPAPALAPLAPDASPEQLRRENGRLREGNRNLLMERGILRKATAFFARESS